MGLQLADQGWYSGEPSIWIASLESSPDIVQAHITDPNLTSGARNPASTTKERRWGFELPLVCVRLDRIIVTWATEPCCCDLLLDAQRMRTSRSVIGCVRCRQQPTWKSEKWHWQFWHNGVWCRVGAPECQQI